jgi:zinc-binding alcohol dehydrogenase family protein
MKAVALNRYLPITHPEALLDVELPAPTIGEHDLLVRVAAVSVNPVDTKVRAPKDKVETSPRVLGWDAAGAVEAVGAKVSGFAVGDTVYYAGDITRPGSNAELQAVDARLVAKAPATLRPEQAAALPLTALTAWEGLFDRLGIAPDGADKGKSLLLIGGAGGVGSLVIQLAKHAGLKVIATAGRPESAAWCRELGAELVVGRDRPLVQTLAEQGIAAVDYIYNAADTDGWWDDMVALIRPQGRITSIVENKGPLDQNVLKTKSAAFGWEFMFTRAMYRTADMAEQGRILERIAALIDAGDLKLTLAETLSPISAATLIEAHRKLESGTMIGKLVVHGW